MRAIIVSRRQVHRIPFRLSVYIELSHQSSQLLFKKTPHGECERDRERGGGRGGGREGERNRWTLCECISLHFANFHLGEQPVL